jgi:hypothetical protein
MILLPILVLLGIAYLLLSQGSSSSLSTLVPSLSSAGSTAPQQTMNSTGVNMYKSDGSLTGSSITNDPSTWPGSDPIWNICAGVALAEGYNGGPGVAPYDLNNPGDLSPGDEAGQATCGGAQVHDGSAIILFCTAEGGWNALYTKFSNIVTGRSSTYSSTWSWSQVGAKYAANSAAWVTNVCNYLGVDPSTTPAAYVASQQSSS